MHNSRWRKAPVDRSKEFPELRSKILSVLDNQLDVSRDSLKEHLKHKYPELYEKVRTLHRGMNFEFLFKTLSIPTTSKCRHCNKEVGMRVGGFAYQKFCSNECKSRYRENASFKYKEFTDKDGNTHKYQGYEGVVLEFLDKIPEVSAVTTKDLPLIKYEVSGRKRNYHPDIGAVTTSGRRLLIEVKCRWSLFKSKCSHLNAAKFKAAKELAEQNGFEFWLVVVEDVTKKMHWHYNGVL